MRILYGIMIFAGVLAIGWGFWASGRSKKPLSLAGAASLPLGLVIAILGILLSCIPDFFKG